MSNVEQRTATRLRLVGTNLEVVDIESGVEFGAAGKDLSGEGLKFLADMEPAIGAQLQVTLTGTHPSTPTLRAEVTVLRVKAHAAGGYEVASRISRAS